MNKIYSVKIDRYNVFELVNALKRLADEIEDFEYDWYTYINSGGIDYGIFLNINIDKKEVAICNQANYRNEAYDTIDDVIRAVKDLDRCSRRREEYEKLKCFIKTLIGKYDTKDLVAEVYNLFQFHRISENQEMKLYKLVDPVDKVSNPAKLWWEEHRCLEIWNYVH